MLVEGNNSQETAIQGPLSIDEAADRLAGSLNLDSGNAAPNPEPESEMEAAPAETEEANNDAQSEAEAETEYEAEAEEEGNEYEADEDASDDEEELLLELNGQQVTLDEVEKGYLRQSDYTKKTQELATQRKEMEALQASIAAEREHLRQMLAMSQAEQAEAPDWVKEAEDDPIGYVQKKALWDAQQAERDVKQAETQRLAQIQQQEQTQKLKVYVAEQTDLAKKAIPELRGENAVQYQAELTTFMEGLGYSKQELSQLYDARALRAFDALMKAEKGANKTDIVKKKVKGKPRVLRPGAPKPKKAAKVQQRQKARSNLRKSGSVDDAVALLMGN